MKFLTRFGFYAVLVGFGVFLAKTTYPVFYGVVVVAVIMVAAMTED